MLGLRQITAVKARIPLGMGVRCFGGGNVFWKHQMPPRPPPVDESEFTEVFLCGSGPGGQKIVSVFHYI